MEQQEYIGFDSIKNLWHILLKYKPKKIFLVTGRDSYEKSGAKKLVDKYLSGYNVVHFSDFEVSPKLKDIEKGIKVFKQNNCDFVIAVGGGSVMDVAKAIRIFAANKGEPIYYINNKETIQNRGLPLVAVPTTAGSGAESTHFALVYIDKT